MLTLTLKGLWAHKLRYALTGLAVVLGVAFMAGTMVLTDTMQRSFDDVVASANDGTDVIVRRAGAIDGDFATARQRVDATTVDAVAAVEGVDVARGAVHGFAQLVRADGDVAADDGFGVTIGANWIDDERLNPFSLSSGRAPAADGEVVLDEATAEDEGWALGDAITVLTNVGPRSFTLVGTATYGGVDGLPGSSLVATTDAAAQDLFAEPGRYDSVVVAAADGVDADELAARLGSALGGTAGGLEVLTGEQDTADQQADIAEDLAFFDQFLLAFAYVALFVGTFIIYNTFSIVVSQRMKDLAMLRAIGARRGQVLRSIVLEAVLVGVLAAAVGLAGGIGLSFGLRALLAGVGLDIPSGSLVVSGATVATAFVVGLATTVLSAVVPAVRASRVRPIAALRDVAVDRSGVSAVRALLGLVVAGAGVVAFAAGLSASGDGALALVGLGAVGVVLGVFVLGPVLVRPALRVLGAPVAATGVSGAYARENARRTPKRTAATAAALMVGVALVAFITILASSMTTSIESAVDRSFRADFVVDSGSFTRGFATTIEDDLAAVPAVETMSPMRLSVAEVDGSTTTVVALDTTVIDELYDLDLASGSVAGIAGDGIAVSERLADDEGIAVGDVVPVRFAGGPPVSLTVEAVFAAEIGDEWLVGLDTFEAHVPDQFDQRLFLTVDDGVPADSARAAIESALAAWPNATVQDQAGFKESVTAEIGDLLNLVYGLLALAIVISLIGIANTLALSVHERTREIGLLRAIGMHRRQLRRAVRWESVLIAGLGAIAGTGLALAAAWGVVGALDGEGVTDLVVPVGRLATVVAVAGIAGVLAAAGPARRASRIDVLQALSSE